MKKNVSITGVKAIVLAFITTLALVGCGTTQPYSFVAEGSPDVASITFRLVGYGASSNAGASISIPWFFSYEDVVGPKGDNKWNPVSFPAGKPLQFTVRAYFVPGMGGVIGLARRVDKKVLFDCPPLEAGKSYDLWFVKSDGATGAGANTLVLTEAMQEDFIQQDGNVLRTALNTRDKLKVVYEQEFTK